MSNNKYNIKLSKKELEIIQEIPKYYPKINNIDDQIDFIINKKKDYTHEQMIFQRLYNELKTNGKNDESYYYWNLLQISLKNEELKPILEKKIQQETNKKIQQETNKKIQQETNKIKKSKKSDKGKETKNSLKSVDSKSKSKTNLNLKSSSTIEDIEIIKELVNGPDEIPIITTDPFTSSSLLSKDSTSSLMDFDFENDDLKKEPEKKEPEKKKRKTGGNLTRCKNQNKTKSKRTRTSVRRR